MSEATSSIIDHLTHVVFDLALPALLAAALAWLRTHFGGELLDRAIKQAAARAYFEVADGKAGTEEAIAHARESVHRSAGRAADTLDGTTIADRLRGEVSLLRANQEKRL